MTVYYNAQGGDVFTRGLILVSHGKISLYALMLSFRRVRLLNCFKHFKYYNPIASRIYNTLTN